jgi:hypothetical protein
MRTTVGAKEVSPALRETAITPMTTEDGTNGEGLANFVGPVLRVGDLADAVVLAIEEDNPGKQVRVVDRGDYVRIRTEQKCRLTKQTLERLLGYAYDLRLLESICPPFPDAARLAATSTSGITRLMIQRGPRRSEARAHDDDDGESISPTRAPNLVRLR